MKPSIDRTKLKGICATCIHADTCANLASATAPIWYCEEFDDSGPADPVTPEPKILEPTIRMEEEVPPVPSNRPKGLCMNCKNFPTCTFPKPEGGVWHCEEYE